MACSGICGKFALDGIVARGWNQDPDLRRCSTCGIIIHRDNWIIRKDGRAICPCCKLQLKTNSRTKKARERRQEQYWKKIEVA